MKKIIIIFIALIILAGVFTLWKYIAPAKTALEICSINVGEVGVITL